MLSPRLLSVLPLLLWSSPAFADAASSAAAEALFNQARELKEQGNYAEACPKLAESQRLDPGTGTLLNLADCYEKANQIASAWATWIDAARSARAAGQSEREEYAKNKAAELEPALGHISLQVDKTAPEGLQIKKDGEIVARAIWGAPLPADARSYRIEASAPGYESFIIEVAVEDGQTTNVIVPALTASAPAPAENHPAPASTPGSAMRTTGWVVAGTGVAGLAAGSILGILAINKNGASKEHCDPSDPNLCQQPGIDLRNEALGFGDAATVAFIAGGALTVGGLVLVLAAPKRTEQVTFTPTLGGGFLTYRGSF